MSVDPCAARPPTHFSFTFFVTFAPRLGSNEVNGETTKLKAKAHENEKPFCLGEQISSPAKRTRRAFTASVRHNHEGEVLPAGPVSKGINP